MFSIVGFVVAAYFRITFAYPMWVMETPAMQAIRRILNGQPLYAPPSLEYVAPVYAPLYFYVSALVASVVGVDLAAPRLVSLVASLGSAALVGYLVWSETRRALVAVVAARTVHQHHQPVVAQPGPRSRGPAVPVLAAGGHRHRSRRQRQSRHAAWLNLASGALTGLAILTKQTAFVMAVPLVLVPLLDRRPLALVAYLVGVVAMTGAGVLLLYAQSGQLGRVFSGAPAAPAQPEARPARRVLDQRSCCPAPASCCCSHQSFSSDAACAASTR